jgi:hypothetical protein
MRLPRKFGVQPAGIATGVQGFYQRRKIDHSAAEWQVVVDAWPHVVEVHIHKLSRATGNGVGQWPLPHALQVADIYCEPEDVGLSASLDKLVKPAQRVDKHPRLRFKAD